MRAADFDCLDIQTGSNDNNDGYVKVYIKTSENCDSESSSGSASGSAAVSVVHDDGWYEAVDSSRLWARESILMSQCFPTVFGVRVQGADSNSWTGFVAVRTASSDGAEHYNAGECASCTGTTTTSYPSITVGAGAYSSQQPER